MNDLTTQPTRKELKEELDKLGVKYGKKDTVAKLQELLDGAQDRKGTGVHPANDPFCEIFSEPKARHPECLDCVKAHGKRYDACQAESEEKKAAKKSGSSGGPSTKVKGKYADFGELKEALEKAPDARLTMCVDKLLLEGQSVGDILEEVKALKETKFQKSNDFNNAAIIQKHIRYRASKGWIFTIHEDGRVQLTGYAAEPQEVAFTKPKVEDEKKAA